MPKKLHLDDFPRLTFKQVKEMAGGSEKVRGAKQVRIHLTTGDIDIPLKWYPSNLGRGEVGYMSCPSCLEGANVLRLIPGGGLLCRRCLERVFGITYRCRDWHYVVNRYRPAGKGRNNTAERICHGSNANQ
jgi:hypothetical protein